MGGLKYLMEHPKDSGSQSHPSRGGWIEISDTSHALPAWIVGSTPHGVGGEIYKGLVQDALPIGGIE